MKATYTISCCLRNKEASAERLPDNNPSPEASEGKEGTKQECMLAGHKGMCVTRPFLYRSPQIPGWVTMSPVSQGGGGKKGSVLTGILAQCRMGSP